MSGSGGCCCKEHGSIIRNFEKKKEAVLGTYMQIKKQENDIYEQFKGL